MSEYNQVIDLIKKYQELRVQNWFDATQLSTEFLTILYTMDVKDIFPRAMVRYLINSGGWPFGIKVENAKLWSDVIEKFFGTATGGNKFVPDNYLDITKSIIKEYFDYDILEQVKVVIEQKKITKKTSTKTSKDDGISGSKIFKSIAETLAEEIKEE